MRGAELYRVSTSGVQPCPLKIPHQSSGQSLKAKAVIPDIPHRPVDSKPVVFKNRYKVQKHSCYDGDGVCIRRQKGPGLTLALSVQFICKMSHKQHSPLFFTDLIQNINSISDQGLKDPISQLHLHTQLILIVVHPLCLLFMELLHLELRKHRGQKNPCQIKARKFVIFADLVVPFMGLQAKETSQRKKGVV